MKKKPHTHCIDVTYSEARHGVGTLDDRICRLARGRWLWWGTYHDNNQRDFTFSYPTRRGAEGALRRLRQAFRGYWLHVTLRPSNAAWRNVPARVRES